MTTPTATPASSPDTEARAPRTGRPMREDDLLRFVWDADPQMAPDGGRVAFTRVWVDAEADAYRTQIWIVGLDGAPARPLTGGVLDSQPRWSPDGSQLAFVRRRDSESPGQIHVLPMEGGDSRAVTSLIKGASEPAWSPDGGRIAFLSVHHPELDAEAQEKPRNEPARVVTKPVFRDNDGGFFDERRKEHVWVVDAGGGEARRLTSGDFGASQVRWSRDGRWVLFVSDRRPEPWFGVEQAKLWAVAGDRVESTDAPELVIDMEGPIGAWTEAENGGIALIGAEVTEASTYDQPGLFWAEGAWPRRPSQLARSHDLAFGEAINSDQHPPRGGGQCPLAVGKDGSVFVRVGHQGSARLVQVRGDALTELTPAGQDLIAGTVSADGSRWALTIGSPTTPGELVSFETAPRTTRVLDAPNRDWLSEVALGEVEEFWYPSFDGARIHAWLVRPTVPVEGGKAPLILEIHGGPHTAYGFGFFHEFHVLAGAGYAVLYTNPRGSTTYGASFARSIQYRFPDEDARDLLAGVDAALARGGLDPDRVGVTGGSGGGLLTNWLIVQSRRFRAAVTQRCVSEWASFYYSADFAMFTPFWFRKPPFEDPEEYRLRSPVAFSSQVTTPLMVIHSEEDWRTPIGQGEAMFRALLHQRKTAVMVRFPGESHELSRSGAPSRRVQNQEHIRRWFDRWLLGKPAPEYGV